MGNYIAYYRISTQKQGKSGLGLEVQKEKVRNYIKEDNARELIGEYIEVQSGKKNNRIELDKALLECKKTNSILLIYKLDRFSRKVSFISKIMESGIKFIVVDMPSANTFQLHIYAALSEEEGRVISERTKEALHQAKLRGVKLGVYGKKLGEEYKKKCNEYYITIKPIVMELYNDGYNYSDISRYLNDNGYSTMKSKRFYPTTIKNYVEYSM